MTLVELRRLALAVGFPDANLAAAVAMAESGGNPSAFGDPSFGGSVGLWQINLPAHPEYSAEALLDPVVNAHAALAISRGGANWSPWTTFRTGAYLKFLPRSTMGLGALLVGILAAGAGAVLASRGR